MPPDPVLADTHYREAYLVVPQTLKKGIMTRVERAGGKDTQSEEAGRADRFKTTQCHTKSYAMDC